VSPRLPALALALALLLGGCGGGDGGRDAARPGDGGADGGRDAAVPRDGEAADAGGTDSDAPPDGAPPEDGGPGADGGPEDGGPSGPRPEPALPLALPFWAPLLDVELEGLGTWPLLVDTGAPALMIAQPLAATLPTRRLAALRFGGREYRDVGYGPYDLALPSGLLGVELGGILGYDLLQELVLLLDYRHARLFPLDRWRPDYDLGPAVRGPFRTLPFTLGSGVLIVVPVSWEGLPAEAAILDTGTTSAVLSQSLFAALGAEHDGRTVLHGSTAVTSTGEHRDTPIIRLGAITLADVPAYHAWATIMPDEFFDAVSLMAEAPVRAIVGGSYLREVALAIDYPGRMLHLAPYIDATHIAPEFVGVGLEVVKLNDIYRVYSVFGGSDAARQGIQPGERLLAVDGLPAASLSMPALQELLQGTPGSHLTLRLAREAGDEYEVTVLREELLPAL